MVGNMAATDARFLSSNFGNSFTINTRIHRWVSHDRSQISIPRAQSSSSPPPSSSDKNRREKKSGNRTTTTKESQDTAAKKLDVAPPPQLKLDDVNPVGLGRRSRQLFDEVWRKFSGLGQISRTTRPDEQETLDNLFIREGPMCEFAIPGAQNVTVLVVGATSRIGRIVVRKLMLRGYTVKALVRKNDEEVMSMLPRSVDIVVGDVGEPSTLKSAVESCNKIIYCATARN